MRLVPQPSRVVQHVFGIRLAAQPRKLSAFTARVGLAAPLQKAPQLGRTTWRVPGNEVHQAVQVRRYEIDRATHEPLGLQCGSYRLPPAPCELGIPNMR